MQHPHFKSLSFRAILCCLLAGALAASGLWGDEPPERLGPQFQVDTGDVYFYLDEPRVSMGKDGAFMVVWQSERSFGTDASLFSVQGRRYDSNGVPLGDAFQVNSFTPTDQFLPNVSVGPQGRVFTVWSSNDSPGSDGSESSVLARRWGPLGPQGTDFQVNSVTEGRQQRATVATAPNGDVVVVWRSDVSEGSDDSASSVHGQRLDASGSPLGGQFQINAFTTGYQGKPRLSFAPDGSFVVVWESTDSPGNDSAGVSVQGQRFDAAGLPVGDQFQVNTYTTGNQRLPDVTVRDDGAFLVVWQGTGKQSVNTDKIQGRRFDSLGQPLSDEQVISPPSIHAQDPSAATTADGRYVVVWAGGFIAGSGEGVSGQMMEPDGSLLESRFQVDTDSMYAYHADVSASDKGEFVVTWYDFVYPQTSGYLLANFVEGQRFQVPFFADGFESGDTSSWSATVP